METQVLIIALQKERLNLDSWLSLHRAPLAEQDDSENLLSRETVLSEYQRKSQRLTDIERVLQKIEDGTFGSCDDCQGRISQERLELILSPLPCFPIITRCTNCQAKLAGAKKREERVGRWGRVRVVSR